jgi:hypothetical protein
MNTIFEILLDVSASMGNMKNSTDRVKYLLPNGETRISLAKEILNKELIPTLDYATNIIIRTFSAPKDSIPKILTLNESQINIPEIILKINQITDDTPNGGTPITAALNVSLENLGKKIYDDYEKVIILISDGEENGGGDYIQVIKKAVNNGIKFKIHIIGIALNENAIEKNKEIALITNGTFHSLNAINYGVSELKRALLPINVSVLSESIKVIEQIKTDNSNDLLIQHFKLENKLIKIQLESQQLSVEKNIKLLNNVNVETQGLLQNNHNQISKQLVDLELKMIKLINDLKNDLNDADQKIINFQNIQKNKNETVEDILNNITKEISGFENSSMLVEKYINLIDEIHFLKVKLAKRKILFWLTLLFLSLVVVCLSAGLLYILKLKDTIDLNYYFCMHLVILEKLFR